MIFNTVVMWQKWILEIMLSPALSFPRISHYISKIFCYNVIIQAIEESAITRLQKYLNLKAKEQELISASTVFNFEWFKTMQLCGFSSLQWECFSRRQWKMSTLWPTSVLPTLSTTPSLHPSHLVSYHTGDSHLILWQREQSKDGDL